MKTTNTFHKMRTENFTFLEEPQIGEEKINISTIHQGELVTGLRLKWLRLRVQMRLFKTIIFTYPNPSDWIAAFQHIIKRRRQVGGGNRVRKVLKINGNIRMGIYSPPWFSKGFDEFLKSQLNDFKRNNKDQQRFTMVFLAITNACPMRCDHCYHWEYLNEKDELSNQELVRIIQSIQEEGVGHIQLSGGEPLTRMDAIEDILKQCTKRSEFWLATSGYKLTQEKANHLKELGLTGVIISLDHYEEYGHNMFRHNPKAYQWVMKAIEHADKAGLLVSLSTCLTGAMQQEDAIERLMELAKAWGVPFVQWLEPMNAGHFKNQDVLLSSERIKKIEALFLQYNTQEAYQDFPIIMYPGYHQRRMGCMFAGNKSIYISSNGHVQACPFCQHDFGEFDLKHKKEQLEEIQTWGCKRFG